MSGNSKLAYGVLLGESYPMGMKARRDRLRADENLLAEWIGENIPAKKGASSVDQFAKLVGIAPSSVYSLCRGVHSPSLAVAVRM